MIYSRANWMMASALALPLFAGVVDAQTCDSLLGVTNCNITSGKPQTLPSDRESDWNFSYAGGNRGFGSDLLTGRSDDDAAMLGGIVFGGSGATCMGPFRWRKC